MAYRGHWIYEDLLTIDTLHGKTPEKYWYVLEKGLDGDTLDADKFREYVKENPQTQATRVQRVLETYLSEARPDLRTPELTEFIEEKMFNVEPVKYTKPDAKPLPTMGELERIFREVSEKPTRSNMSIWTVLRLALSGFPLRVGELSSVEIDNPDAPNYLDTKTGVMILREHKNDKKGARKYDLPEFTAEWVTKSMLTFGRILPRLITNKMGKPQSPKALSKFLNGQGVKLGSQTIRPVITTATLASGADYTERQKLAHQMGHSEGVQMTKYFKGAFAPE